jgi:predicted acylesterase/phospholipase RssA
LVSGLTVESLPDLRRPRLRELQAMELVLMRASVADPTWLAAHDEAALRWALSLARISAVNVLPHEGDPGLVEIDHATNTYREKLYTLLRNAVDCERVLSRDGVRAQIGAVRVLAAQERSALLSLFGNRVPAASLDRCTRRRPLALALGGGGGTGYVYVGAMAVLDEAGLVPSLIAGTSMGAIIGAFRAKQRDFSLTNIRALLARLSWKRVFRLFETESRFGLPATLKLYLREVIGHEFEKDDDEKNGHFLRLNELEIPLRVTIAGLVQGPKNAEVVDRYAHLLDDAVRDVKALRSRAGTIARALQEMSRQPVRPIYVGGDELTRDFDVLDAIGFSSAVPGVIHYDILRDDPRMVALVGELFRRENVFRLVDGGLADNLPAREAWRSVQAGACGERDPFVVAMDAFAPQLTTRHLLFLPLMRIAAENSRAGRQTAHLTLNFKHVLSPLAVVPSPTEFMRAVENGRKETEPYVALIRKMVGPIPDPPGIVAPA